MHQTKVKIDKQLVKVAKQLGQSLDNSGVKAKRGEGLLSYRMRRYGIPAFTSQPIDNQVIVWRLPPLRLSAGGLIIPESEQSPNTKGILLAAGPRAWDTLHSNGIELGHIVTFSRFSGWEKHDNTPEANRHSTLLYLKDKDILSSDDLKVAMDAGKMRYVQGQDGKFRLGTVTTPQRKALGPSARKKKLLALAANAGSPHEAETARKMAAKVR